MGIRRSESRHHLNHDGVVLVPRVSHPLAISGGVIDLGRPFVRLDLEPIRILPGRVFGGLDRLLLAVKC